MAPFTRTCLLATFIAVASCSKPAPPPPAAPPTAAPPPVTPEPDTGGAPPTMPQAPETSMPPAGPTEPPPPKAARRGLELRLGEGENTAAGPARLPPAQAAPLTDADTEKVLGRLPPLVIDPGDAPPFAKRAGSLPAPRTGKTIKASFPPPPDTSGEAPTAAPGPLEVLRFSPDGDVAMAPNLSVTFSQPMVAVTSHDDSVKNGVPVTLTPVPPGGWRWVGTKTLLFESEKRFPMATEFKATVPAGTKSATGGALAAERTWTFRTPPVTLRGSYPTSGPQKLDPLLFASFDQAIDKGAVLKTIRVSADGRDWPLRLATAEEVEADETVRSLTKGATDGRWVAFKLTGKLPTDEDVTVTVGPGTPSAEGPRTSDKPQTFGFRTYGPLDVKEVKCGWRDECHPLQPWTIELSNPLDLDAFDEKLITVDPPVPGMKIDASGNYITLTGVTKGRTRYKIKVDAALKDVFGQTLGRADTSIINVGSAEPMFWAHEGFFFVLDPAARPELSLFTINHKSVKVTLHVASPEDWERFRKYTQEVGRTDKTPTLPGRRVVSRSVEVEDKPDELIETRIDLSPALKNGLGLVIVQAEPTEQPKEEWRRQRITTFVQATHMGLTALVDDTDLLGWATSLNDGKRLEGVALSILPDGANATTGADGAALLPLPESGNVDGPRVLVAKKGDDVALLPENTYAWASSSGWVKRTATDWLQWYVFDDRNLYRPAEEVHVKGWIRRMEAARKGEVQALGSDVSMVTWALKDSRGNEISKGEAAPNALGGFDFALKLPDTMNLGTAQIHLAVVGGSEALGGRSHSLALEVQEFRRPEFEVSAEVAGGPHLVHGKATATLEAKYYAGGGLPNAEVLWRVTSSAGSFTPPNQGEFSFGTYVPWWESRGADDLGHTDVLKAHTDSAGVHRLAMDFDAISPPRPMSVVAEGVVTDVNRQAWTATASLLVHPASLYVGLRPKRSFVQKGEPLDVDFIVADLDGKAVAGRPISVKAVRMEWTVHRGEWKEEEKDAQSCELTSAAAPQTCHFETKEGGGYVITAHIVDPEGRPNESEARLYVAGGKMPVAKHVEQEVVTLIPDRKEYQPGDVAKVLVQAPFSPAEGVLTTRRAGILTTEHFTMDGATTTLSVPVAEHHLGGLEIAVDLVGAALRPGVSGAPDPGLPKRPAYAAGSLTLPVPPRSRTLTLTATPRVKAIEPGGVTTLDVTVTDASGKPVTSGEVAVAVVDESVLALTGYRLSDPIPFFYMARGGGVNGRHLRESILLVDPSQLSANVPGEPPKPEAMPAPSPTTAARFEGDDEMAEKKAEKSGEGGEGKDGGSAPIQIRKDFNPLALFAPAVPIDASGKTAVPLKVPDNLTRYRIMVVAVAGARQFGLGESTITARLPLMVRASPPRFLNFGDTFELPVVLQNQTDAAMEVDVAVRTAGATLTAGAGRRVSIPANDRVEVRFPASVVHVGTARFQVGAAAGAYADASEHSLPVWTPATTEAFATDGVIDQGVSIQPVQAPSDVFKEFGGLEITTSSTAVQALTDAVLYLVAYPFECAEQLSSRILAVASLKDVLTAFQAEGLPKPEAMIAAVERDMKRLSGMQNGDGGFGFWKRGEETWPYLTVHVTHALQRAKLKGFAPNPRMMERAHGYLKSVESHFTRDYGEEEKREITAYALYVRNLMGDADPERAKGLIREAGGVEKMPLEALGWLLTVLSPGGGAEVEAIRKHVNNKVTETAAGAHFTTSYSDSSYLILASDRRTDGVLLEALIGDQPKSDLIPKLVADLLDHRTRGRWGSTQENAFVLLALDRYFNTYEKETPDFVARAWLGKEYAGEHAFKGRTTERFQIDVPMALVAQTAEAQPLAIEKKGPGRLYYRIGMSYAPSNLKLAPADHGFVVERRYEAVDAKDDVSKDAEGTWHVKAGARVRIKLTMVAPTRRTHVALVDPLPAGFEALNPELRGTESLPPTTDDDGRGGEDDEGGESYRRGWWRWWGPWYNHENLRDERAEAFTSLLWEGVHTYTYVARATTPGNFVAPPTKAEEMYHPETFGRGASDRVIVE